MKLFKRINALTLALVMAVMLFGTSTVFAAENTGNYTFSKNTDIQATPYSNKLIDQTFNMTGTHVGSTRTYNCNSISFQCYFFNQNGTTLPANGAVLAVRLYDDTTGAFVNEWQSNNIVVTGSQSISYGHRYHFEYLVAYGTQSLKINMKIYG